MRNIEKTNVNSFFFFFCKMSRISTTRVRCNDFACVLFESNFCRHLGIINFGYCTIRKHYGGSVSVYTKCTLTSQPNATLCKYVIRHVALPNYRIVVLSSHAEHTRIVYTPVTPSTLVPIT